LRILKLLLPGRYEDAYIYMGYLFALTENKTLRTLSLERMAKHLEAQFPSTGTLPELMFSRNDWLTSSQFKALMKNREVATAFLSILDRFSSDPVELAPSLLDSPELPLDISATVFLDMLLYNRRLYLSTENGLYHIDFDIEPEGPEMTGRAQRRLDARCLSASAKFGTIAASCGDDGLFTILNDFEWLGSQSITKKLAEKSLRSSWFHYDLMNYSSNASPLLLLSQHERRPSLGVEREKMFISDIGDRQVDFTRLLENDIQLDDVQYVFNSSNTIFVNTIHGQFFSIGISTTDQMDPRIRYSRAYSGTRSRMLSASPTRVGLLVETDDEVLLFAGGEWLVIVDSAVLSVRTFMRSKRYQNMSALTLEDGILITSFFDDTSLRV